MPSQGKVVYPFGDYTPEQIQAWQRLLTQYDEQAVVRRHQLQRDMAQGEAEVERIQMEIVQRQEFIESMKRLRKEHPLEWLQMMRNRMRSR